MGRTTLLGWLLLAVPATARWCQVENVKADVYGNYSYMGAWRVDGCTTLSLDHGYCAEVDCPWRVKFTDEAIIELADKLHGNTVLTALSIASNDMSDEGAIAIAEALRDNEALNDLNLAGNTIGDAGALAFAEVLAKNAVFTNLNLEYNSLTDEGGRALLGLLKSNESALETLHMGHNKMDASIVAEADEENQASFRPPTGTADTTASLPSRDEL